MKLHNARRGFTMIELVVVISILAVLSGALVPQVAKRMAAARDARRLGDVQAVRDAVEQYYRDRGELPAARRNGAAGGWDVSHDGDFIPELVRKGYLREAPRDPRNDDAHHYRYFVFEEGAYGCGGVGPYYVLGVKRFETEEYRSEHKGYFRCRDRNWGNEFDYVTGGGGSARGAGAR